MKEIRQTFGAMECTYHDGDPDLQKLAEALDDFVTDKLKNDAGHVLSFHLHCLSEYLMRRSEGKRDKLDECLGMLKQNLETVAEVKFNRYFGKDEDLN